MKNLPYAQQAGTLKKMLNKIRTASVPEKFSQDFVSTKLSMRGGTARSTIPFIKKMGLVSSEGSPTNRYKAFRNSDKSKIAIAEAIREVYATLFEMNEYVYELDNTKLKGLIVEATGAETNSTPVKRTLATFNVLKEMADFENKEMTYSNDEVETESRTEKFTEVSVPINKESSNSNTSESINLAYTINLHLPPTTDVEVFNAIFKSLKRHLLQD